MLQKGKILIAKPTILNDRSFNRTVILLSEHNEDGSVGFILNKPSKYTMSDLITGISSDFVIYNGGPVSKDSLYYIHSMPDLIPNSIPITENLYWSGNFEVIKKLLTANLLSKQKIRFFLGYTGWSEKQLDEEIESNSWLLKNNNYPDILSVAPQSFWHDELMKSGGDYQVWANSPENPNMN